VPQTVGVPNADENSLNPHSGRGRFSQIDEGVEVGAGVGERGKFSELDVDFAFASSKDCTHLFTGADIAGYQIFRNVTGFAVMDKYAAVKKNIAPAILQTKKDVAKFLDELGVVVDMNPVPQNTSTSASKQPESLRVPEHADSMNHSDPADSMSISELVNSL
jgi:hypothetical protein